MEEFTLERVRRRFSRFDEVPEGLEEKNEEQVTRKSRFSNLVHSSDFSQPIRGEVSKMEIYSEAIVQSTPSTPDFMKLIVCSYIHLYAPCIHVCTITVYILNKTFTDFYVSLLFTSRLLYSCTEYLVSDE